MEQHDRDGVIADDARGQAGEIEAGGMHRARVHG
jgi:hypothetical protein